MCDTGNATSAIAAAGETDVVVLDVAMPDVDGLTALARMQKAHPGTAVVMYSAYDAPYLRAEATARGAVAFLSKNATADQLMDTIENVARRTGARPATPTEG